MIDEWRGRAECKGKPIDWFYPAEGSSASAEALATCVSCPVRSDCLEHAIAHEDYGYWAGTSARERRRMRRARGIRLDTPSTSAVAFATTHGTRAEYLQHLPARRKAVPLVPRCERGGRRRTPSRVVTVDRSRHEGGTLIKVGKSARWYHPATRFRTLARNAGNRATEKTRQTCLH